MPRYDRGICLRRAGSMPGWCAGPVFSASWYRVAALRPVLRRQARIVRHTYRGERWYVLQDLASGRFLRLDPTAYRIVALMDGVRSMDAIWTQVCGELGDDGPTQDETLGLLDQLHQANVLLTDQAPDSEEMRERARKSRWTRIKQYVGNPLSLKHARPRTTNARPRFRRDGDIPRLPCPSRQAACGLATRGHSARVTRASGRLRMSIDPHPGAAT